MFNKRLIIFCLILLAAFSFTEIWLWFNVDAQNDPMRYFRGDTAHYMSILHSARITGEPSVNSYFFEQADEPVQFFMFQKFIELFNVLDINTIWFALLLKILVVLSAFYILTKIFSLFGVRLEYSYLASFAFLLFYGPTSFQGYALGFWFLPLFLLAFYLSALFFIRPFENWTNIWGPILAIVLASCHPVYFFMTGLALLTLILIKVFKEPNKELIYSGILWAIFSLVIMVFLFLPQIVINWPASEDTLYRIVAVNTRIPIHILVSMRLLILALLPFALFGKGFLEKRWLIISAFAISAFVGVNSYLLTGVYVVNDHYAIGEDFLVIAACLLMLKNSTVKIRSAMIFGYVLLSISILSTFIIWDYLNFQPGYYGKWLPMHLAYFILSLVLIWPELRKNLFVFFENKYVALIVFVILPLIYGSLITYKDFQPQISRHLEAQEYRDVAEFLKTKESGVVLANPFISEVIYMATLQKVYWSSVAFSETVTNNELQTRWSDVYLFFPENNELVGSGAEGSLMGTLNRCSDFGRKRWIVLASKIGFQQADETFCGLIENRKIEFSKIKEEAGAYSRYLNNTKIWFPEYTLDWLIVSDKDKIVNEWLIDRYFTLEKDFGTVKLYRFKRHPSS